MNVLEIAVRLVAAPPPAPSRAHADPPWALYLESLRDAFRLPSPLLPAQFPAGASWSFAAPEFDDPYRWSVGDGYELAPSLLTTPGDVDSLEQYATQALRRFAPLALITVDVERDTDYAARTDVPLSASRLARTRAENNATVAAQLEGVLGQYGESWVDIIDDPDAPPNPKPRKVLSWH